MAIREDQLVEVISLKTCNLEVKQAKEALTTISHGMKLSSVCLGHQVKSFNNMRRCGRVVILLGRIKFYGSRVATA